MLTAGGSLGASCSQFRNRLKATLRQKHVRKGVAVSTMLWGYFGRLQSVTSFVFLIFGLDRLALDRGNPNLVMDVQT